MQTKQLVYYGMYQQTYNYSTFKAIKVETNV